MTPTNNRKVLVWDLPLRIFHWLFAATLSAALLLGLTADDHSSLFTWHMLFGIAAGFLLLVRIIIGLVTRGPGSIGNLLRAPLEAVRYVTGMLAGKAKRHLGHNPLASMVYLLMFVLLGLTILTGLNMDNELAEEAHELFAYGLLATIIGHLLGIAFHTLFFRENVALSMLHGKKVGDPAEASASSRPILGGIVLFASLIFIGKLFANYDSTTHTVKLPIINTTLTLGEDEDGDHGERHHKNKHHDDDD